MLLNKKKFMIFLIIFLSSMTLDAAYVESNKDTKLPPDSVTYVIQEPTDMQFLKQVGPFKYYFRDSRDVFAIFDTRNGYTWKTGLDIEFDNKIKDDCDALLERTDPVATEAEILATCVPLEDRMNTLYEGIGNSLLSMEYYDSSLGIKTISSASENAVRSTLVMVNNDDTHYRLDVTFDVIDVMVSVHIYLTSSGLEFEIRDDEINGNDTNQIAAFIFSPFLGASGGQQLIFDMAEMDYPRATQAVPKPRIPGYIFLPDGSGALMRFQDNTTSLSTYIGDVYGPDMSSGTYHYRYQNPYVPMKDPSMPVFGIAHGNRQAAFVAYATSGAEYMEIIGSPHNNRTPYNYVYSRFTYNQLYQQIYNQSGAGYPTLYDERNHFNASLKYDFLQGDGTTDDYPADYVGMAKKYRDHLIEVGILNNNLIASDQMPIRLDFIMSDAMNNLIGTRDVVVTTIDQVKEILTQLHGDGIQNINSGLYGYQKGGITLGDKDRPDWIGAIGSRRNFENVIGDLNDLGIDVSLALDYVTIYEEQMSLLGNAAKHLNGWYTREHMFREVGPVEDMYFARPTLVASWMKSHEKRVRSLGMQSMTYAGMTNQLYGDYGRSLIDIQGVIDLYQNTLNTIGESYAINAVNPNQYLWAYVSRYLQSPMFTSQYLIQTDTVPFLQIVLSGSMEVYATYANFSFYTETDILRMIDYNVYPSFILTHDPSYELISTNSSNFYSTEFNLYEDLIHHIYRRMNGAYESVLGSQWIDRMVVSPGVIVNRYANGVEIVINYTNDIQTYNGRSISPLNYRVLD
jgi:hypothetical protein